MANTALVKQKLQKLKKPIKRKQLKKRPRYAFKEGGAVEKFLAKYPDFDPES
jgi:hypothetical protein